MTTYVRKPLPIDREKTNLWAIASLSSVGVGLEFGPVGMGGNLNLFDLVNRTTHRAHRMAVKSGAGGVSLVPFISGSVSFGTPDYENFRTPRDVSFFDFHGTFVNLKEINLGLYSLTWVTFERLNARVGISGGGLNIPGAGHSGGWAEMLFSDGRPLGNPDLEVKMPPIPKEPGPFREHAKEDALVYRIPGDVLFGFDKWRLPPLGTTAGKKAQDALGSLMNSIHWTPEYRFLIVGHTDALGSAEYNKKLSKRRAETVAQWLRDHKFGRPEWFKTVGRGKSEPIAANDTQEGRQKNRRVEVIAIRTKYWEDYTDKD